MTLRLLLTVLLLGGGYGAYCWMRCIHLRRLAKLDSQTDPVLSRLRPGVPAVVYFTTPGCIPCRMQQQPALQSLYRELGDEAVQIVKIDAAEEPDIANQWGVMTAPTTFIVDHNGATQTVNHGVADVDKLKFQLNALWMQP